MKTYNWDFPLPRTHTGILQGNGRFGVMIWGEKNILRLTLGRSDIWDHRGGSTWTAEMSYKTILDCLKSGDEARLNQFFTSKPGHPGEPARPTILPIGRIELDFGPEAELIQGTLSLNDALVQLSIRIKNREFSIQIALDMGSSTLALALQETAPFPVIRRVPAWKYVGDHLQSVGFSEPLLFDTPELSGWTQVLPADPAYCVGYHRKNNELTLAVTREDTADAARETCQKQVQTQVSSGFNHLQATNSNWWQAYWQHIPEIDIPNERLRFLYEYGMYKFAGLTNPDGVAATLQGPWIEEYQMPPWSNDYHFNINVQLCYQPAFHGNCLEHLRPLFEMIDNWTPTLRQNAKYFVGIDDGLMLPHAVSDSCVFISSYWGHSADHGCTAWIAQMMYRYYRYTMDREFLRTTAYPFMKGAMRVYEEMLSRPPDGTLRLEIGISPEYFTPDQKGFGPNASFQLACIHRLAEDLIQAADELNEKAPAIWQEIREKLPLACLSDEPDAEKIILWEGQYLEESHRHHSHLAGITPFDILPLNDPKWRPILARSIQHWINRGPAMWSGWCVPWASCIHSHLDNAEAAELWLEIFDRVFTNIGHGTLHDAGNSGFSLMGASAIDYRRDRQEIMQMDGGMGATAAIQEMLLHTRSEVNHLFAGAPPHWRNVAFSGMRTDGAFLVDAKREAGQVTEVKIKSPAGGLFRLANPWNGPAQKWQNAEPPVPITGDILTISTNPGDTLTLRP